ncbi:MAG: glycosyltransferase [Comamonadaceae bacterium]|nr:MAG: glycosyltransferase [Comamonadaceae bacterium]
MPEWCSAWRARDERLSTKSWRRTRVSRRAAGQSMASFSTTRCRATSRTATVPTIGDGSASNRRPVRWPRLNPDGPEPPMPAAAKRVIAPVTFEWTVREDAIRDIVEAVNAKSCRVFAFCNMHTFNLARRSSSLAQALGKATVFNDGLGIDIASRILFGSKFPENLNGTDLTPALLARFGQPVSIYLVGSAPGVAESAAEALATRFPAVTIAGCQHGFFDASEDNRVADEIRAANADLVLVGMGNPRQELWATNISERAGAVVLCVGAYIDFAAGRFSRAPAWVRRLRCEWAYRLVLEPSRMWRRYFGGAPPFLLSVLSEKRRQPRSG